MTVPLTNETPQKTQGKVSSNVSNNINNILSKNKPSINNQGSGSYATNYQQTTTTSIRQSNPIQNKNNYIQQPEPKLTIQSPKNQFINGNQNSIHPVTSTQGTIQGNVSMTNHQQSQHKTNFNFNFDKNSNKGNLINERQGYNQSTQNKTNLLNMQQNANQQSANQDKGYKSFIQMANNKDNNSRTANTSPVVKQGIQPTSFAQNQSPTPQTSIQKMQQQIAQSQKVSPVRNVSPGEKIVIKKSEIKFKKSGKDEQESLVESQVDIHKNMESPHPSDFIAQSKQLAFDFIRSMLSMGNSQNPETQKDKDEINQSKKKFVKFGSPGPQKTLKKQNINFVLDMKKHGIQKDIESVKAMRFYLENSPMQSDNSGILDNSQQNSPIDMLKKRENEVDQASHSQNLQIQTVLQVDQMDKDALKKSPNNENSYIFPFQRRARSLSPPKENNLGDNSQNTQGSNESPSGIGLQSQNILSNFKITNETHSIVQSKLNQNNMHNNNGGTQKDGKGHNRNNSGPIIPDRNCIEKVIKNTPGLFFGIGPHLSRQGEYEERQQQELEQQILKGREVDDWLIEEESKEKKTERNKIVTMIPTTTMNAGFIGDADDVDEIEDGQDDDWMFQTFEKKKQKAQVNNFTKDINEIEQEDFLIPDDDVFEDENPSINQFGSESGGYTNMLDKWLNNLQ